ncbi:MAG TPA: CsbD family protein [Terriglobales bacterium]|nr:CsbD family protein [Terriglobales bacterium]
MAGKADQAKGRVKEAAGALTNDKSLKQEGKIDQAAGRVKETANAAVDKVKRAVTGEKRYH